MSLRADRSAVDLQRVLRRRHRRTGGCRAVSLGLADAGVQRQQLGRGRRDHDWRTRARSATTPPRWFLVPRAIPQMEDTPERFTRVARSDGSAASGRLSRKARRRGRSAQHESRPAGSRVPDDGLPRSRDSGGKGAVGDADVRGSLHEATSDGTKGPKGNRDEMTRQGHCGPERQIPAGRRQSPDCSVRSGGAPSLCRGQPSRRPTSRSRGRTCAARFHGVSLPGAGHVREHDPVLSKIWDVGWRTARLCAHETYMDTPYWEQLQYVGDTRIQALISLYSAGDDRLVKNAIELFDESRLPDGLTQSRYPDDAAADHPAVLAVLDRDDARPLHVGGERRRCTALLARRRAVLDWFARRRDADRIARPARMVELRGLGRRPRVRGRRAADREGGGSAILSLQFVLALREAADLDAAFGSAETRGALSRARRRVALRGHARRRGIAGKQLFADTPTKKDVQPARQPARRCSPTLVAPKPSRRR